MFKPNDIVKIKKLGLNDVFPIYGQPFKLEEGDVLKILVTDFSDEKYPYFVRLGKYEFWLSADTILEKVEEKENKSLKENKDLEQEIKNIIYQLNKLLDFFDNE